MPWLRAEGGLCACGLLPVREVGELVQEGMAGQLDVDQNEHADIVVSRASERALAAEVARLKARLDAAPIVY